MKMYEKKTRIDLLRHPLMAKLQACTSDTDILIVLRAQVQQMRGDDRLTRWLNPTVRVLHAYSGALDTGVGLVNPIRMTLL